MAFIEQRMLLVLSSKELPLKPLALICCTFFFVKAEKTLAKTSGMSPLSCSSSLSPNRLCSSSASRLSDTSHGASFGSWSTRCG